MGCSRYDERRCASARSWREPSVPAGPSSGSEELGRPSAAAPVVISASAVWVNFDRHEAVAVAVDHPLGAVLATVYRRRSQPHLLLLAATVPRESLELDGETQRIPDAEGEVLGAPCFVVERLRGCGRSSVTTRAFHGRESGPAGAIVRDRCRLEPERTDPSVANARLSLERSPAASGFTPESRREVNADKGFANGTVGAA